MYVKTSSPYLFLHLDIHFFVFIFFFFLHILLNTSSTYLPCLLPPLQSKTYLQIIHFLSLWVYFHIKSILFTALHDRIHSVCVYQFWFLLHKFSPILGSMWSWKDFFCRHIATIFAPLLQRGDLSVSLYLFIMPLYLFASVYLCVFVFVIFARSCLFLGLTAFGRLLH